MVDPDKPEFSDKSLENLWEMVCKLIEKVEIQEEALKAIYEYNARRIRDENQPQGIHEE